MVQHVDVQLGPDVHHSVPGEGGQLDLLVDRPTNSNLRICEHVVIVHPGANGIIKNNLQVSKGR